MDEPPATRAESQSDLPEFMRAAGWMASSAAEEPPAPISEPEPLEDTDIAPGEMPDWLEGNGPQRY